MKKWFLSILTMVYMMVSSGVALEIHYCMGERTGADLFASTEKKCGRCGMTEKKGCCNDEHKFYKLADAHKNVTNDHTFTCHDATLNPLPVFAVVDLIETQPSVAIQLAPPETGPPLYISYCVFRI